MQPRHHQQAFINRFVAACQADARVTAAFLGGSYARGAADAFSDVDLYLITTDEAHEDFLAGREVFLKQLGELVFLESFDLPDIAFYIFADGTEGELGLGRAGRFNHIHSGPYQVLLDKTSLLKDVAFTGERPAPTEQHEKLRRQVYGFWHDFSHFITALGRGQLWWAAGQIEVVRGICVNLVRLKENFAEAEVGDEPYFKVDQAIRTEVLSDLRATFCPMERNALLQAAFVVLRFYQAVASELTQTHGIDYPTALERVMVDRLKQL